MVSGFGLAPAFVFQATYKVNQGMEAFSLPVSLLFKLEDNNIKVYKLPQHSVLISKTNLKHTCSTNVQVTQTIKTAHVWADVMAQWVKSLSVKQEFCMSASLGFWVLDAPLLDKR